MEKPGEDLNATDYTAYQFVCAVKRHSPSSLDLASLAGTDLHYMSLVVRLDSEVVPGQLHSCSTVSKKACSTKQAPIM